ncbi:hypothetical protein [Acinetobacter sp. MB5]|uniref:hypothetical protein n=1 Tax=Acinetobacter sp. MB5 TaxID=2069438 RepID=UPI000DCFD33E|nr:hypothetical protein [Acinetobacter sp. MB5]
MKKMKQVLWLTLCLTPSLCFANQHLTTEQAVVQGNTAIVISPRTGIRYAVGNTEGRAVQIETEAIAPADRATIKRIVAANPALSVESQQKAEQSLLSMD